MSMNCYGCEQRSGQQCLHDVVFTDSRTGRTFCHEDTAALVTWELDGSPDPEQFPYPEWIGDREPETEGCWVRDSTGFWTFHLGVT